MIKLASWMTLILRLRLVPAESQSVGSIAMIVGKSGRSLAGLPPLPRRTERTSIRRVVASFSVAFCSMFRARANDCSRNGANWSWSKSNVQTTKRGLLRIKHVSIPRTGTQRLDGGKADDGCLILAHEGDQHLEDERTDLGRQLDVVPLLNYASKPPPQDKRTQLVGVGGLGDQACPKEGIHVNKVVQEERAQGKDVVHCLLEKNRRSGAVWRDLYKEKSDELPFHAR